MHVMKYSLKTNAASKKTQIPCTFRTLTVKSSVTDLSAVAWVCEGNVMPDESTTFAISFTVVFTSVSRTETTSDSNNDIILPLLFLVTEIIIISIKPLHCTCAHCCPSLDSSLYAAQLLLHYVWQNPRNIIQIYLILK